MPKQRSIFEKDIDRDKNTEGKIKESKSEEEILKINAKWDLFCVSIH